MKMKTLQDLFIHELKDLHNAEKQLTKALPKMAKAASSDDLRQAFEDHLHQTEEHLTRLERIMADFDLPLRGHKCKAMEGLVEEGKEILANSGLPIVAANDLGDAAKKIVAEVAKAA